MVCRRIYQETFFCFSRVCYPLQQHGSTGTLVNHMKRKHPTTYFNEVPPELPETEKRIVTKEIFQQKVIKFLVCTYQPFTIVEDPFFKEIIDYCSEGNDSCELFSAATAKNHVTQLFSEYKTSIITALQSNTGKISFIIDCWTSSNQHPFQGVIARWVSDDWKLNNAVIDLTILSGNHTGKNIAKSFWNVLNEFGLTEKLLSVTTDNASNMDTLFDELETLFASVRIIFVSED